uniref:Small ribosomal subunit protein uS4c n=1 Tax=Chloroparvula japonica TaxID=1411623 RepID=A0A4D6C3B3_9CHLO|nr:ribosomal protein S4 [Chloroparvula japonica]QBX98154.1 ribosomal protein S4 [Chloroparvula japonica]
MARYRGPRLKVVRRLGRLPGLTQKTARVRSTGMRSRPSQFAVRLMEKQRLRYHYGLTEKQLVNYVSKARRAKEATGTALFAKLEARLDNTVFRLGLAPTIRAARQLISHGHINVNLKRVNKPSFSCRTGDVITVRDNSKSKELVERYLSQTQQTVKKKGARSIGVPPNLSLRKAELMGRVQGLPRRNWLGLRINDLFVIEYYSRRGGSA